MFHRQFQGNNILLVLTGLVTAISNFASANILTTRTPHPDHGQIGDDELAVVTRGHFAIHAGWYAANAVM